MARHKICLSVTVAVVLFLTAHAQMSLGGVVESSNREHNDLALDVYYIPFDMGTFAPVTMKNAKETMPHVKVTDEALIKKITRSLRRKGSKAKFIDGAVRIYVQPCKGSPYAVDTQGTVYTDGKSYSLKPRAFLDLYLAVSPHFEEPPPGEKIDLEDTFPSPE